MQKQRNINIELLRIISSFMVVSIHITPINIDNASHIIQGVVRSGMPIFFMISGLFILKSNINNLFSWYCSRLTSLIIPFIAFGYIHFLIMVYLISPASLSDATPALFFKTITESTTKLSGHFWFVYAMIGIYLIAPAINALCTNINEKMAIRAYLIFLILSAINTHYKILSMANLVTEKNIFSPPSLDIWLQYFINGFLLYRAISYLNIKVITFMTFSGLILTIYFSYITSNKYEIAFHQYTNGISMLLFCSGLFSLFIKFEVEINALFNKHSRIIQWISEKTYGVYLIHIAIYTFIRYKMPIPFENLYNNKNYILLSIIIFIVSLLFSSIVGMVVSPLIRTIKNITATRQP